MVTTLMAWNAGPAWLDSGLHDAGAFLTSPGLAGTAAVIAAWIAANQVRHTRKADTMSGRRDALWERFQWIVEQSSPTVANLGIAEAMGMFAGIKNRCGGVEDEHLFDLIDQFEIAVVMAIDPDYVTSSAAAATAAVGQ